MAAVAERLIRRRAAPAERRPTGTGDLRSVAIQQTEPPLHEKRTVGAGLNSRRDLLVHHRLAARSLGRITGRVEVEDVLDVVFREFCIGK